MKAFLILILGLMECFSSAMADAVDWKSQLKSLKSRPDPMIAKFADEFIERTEPAETKDILDLLGEKNVLKCVDLNLYSANFHVGEIEVTFFEKVPGYIYILKAERPDYLYPKTKPVVSFLGDKFEFQEHSAKKKILSFPSFVDNPSVKNRSIEFNLVASSDKKYESQLVANSDYLPQSENSERKFIRDACIRRSKDKKYQNIYIEFGLRLNPKIADEKLGVNQFVTLSSCRDVADDETYLMESLAVCYKATVQK